MKKSYFNLCAVVIAFGITGCLENLAAGNDNNNTATQEENAQTAETPDYSQLDAADPYLTNLAEATATMTVPAAAEGDTIVDSGAPVSDPIPTVSTADCGGAMWCGSSGVANVNTGIENVSGFWFFYTDTSSGGNSEYTWPADPNVDGWESVIEACGGICGVATLGEAYEYPYMGVGFVVADDSTRESGDITDWGGICVTYSADKPMRIAIHPKDSVQQLLDYDDYRTELPPGTSKTMNVPWSEFHQDGWGHPYDQAKLLKQVETVIFVYQDGVWGESVNFSITKVGKFGTCK